MNTYHVLLLYPDHIADQYGETYLHTADAPSFEQAVDAAKHACIEAYCEGGGVPVDPNDFVTLLVVCGGEVV